MYSERNYGYDVFQGGMHVYWVPPSKYNTFVTKRRLKKYFKFSKGLDEKKMRTVQNIWTENNVTTALVRSIHFSIY